VSMKVRGKWLSIDRTVKSAVPLSCLFLVMSAAAQPPATTVPQDGVSLGTLGEGDPATRAAVRNRPAPPAGRAPKTPDGRPDFSGVYYGPQSNLMTKPDLLPWAEELVTHHAEKNGKDSPPARCLPAGPLRLVPLFKVVQTPSLIMLIVEEEGYRQIFLDGRNHPKDFNPTWYGHSIGKWDGDTLVVDTMGFNDVGTLNPQGVPHSEQMHLTERFRRPDLGHLEIDVAIDDPKVFSKPWIMQRVANLAPGEEIMEFICNENNRDLQHMVGK
jgi:hypothetical protein